MLEVVVVVEDDVNVVVVTDVFFGAEKGFIVCRAVKGP